MRTEFYDAIQIFLQLQLLRKSERAMVIAEPGRSPQRAGGVLRKSIDGGNEVNNPYYAEGQPYSEGIVPQPPFLPSWPAYQMPMIPQSNIFMNQVAASASQIVQSAMEVLEENGRLKAEQAKRQAEVNAYNQVFSDNGGTYTTDKQGRRVELLNCRIEGAYHLFPQLPETADPFYVAKIEGMDQLVTLSEDVYASNGRLVQAFQELLGNGVRQCHSLATTAFLLRGALKPQPIVLDFYGGWHRDQAGMHRFWLSGSGSTHRASGETSSFVMVAAEKCDVGAFRDFRRCMHQVVTDSLRDCLTLWFHAAALTTLLDDLGFPFPLTLYLDVSDAKAQSWTIQLFRWFGSSPLSLDTQESAFCRELLHRCDQPLLIIDQRQTTFAATNSQLLEQIIVTRAVPFKSKRRKDPESLPCLALPIIVAAAASSLSCSPNCAVTSLGNADFKESAQPPGEGLLHRYLYAFLSFAQERVPQFRDLLEEKRQEVLSTHTGTLSGHYAEAMGILLAIREILNEFARFYGCTDYGWSEESERWICGLLETTSWKSTDQETLAEQFISVARNHLNCGLLCACPVECRARPESNAVFYDEEGLGFTAEAFAAVCRHLNQSRPVVVVALREANLLLGKPINATTAMTRIGIYNQYGIRTTVAVYRLDRNAFDILGDPLTFDGEGEL